MENGQSGINFNIELPGDWQDQTMYYFRGPEIDGLVHEITVNVDRFLQAEDINEYSRDKISPIVQSMDSIEVLKDEEITVQGGSPAYEFIYKWTPAEGVTEIHNYLFVIRDEVGLMILIRFSKKSFKMLKGQFKEVIEEILPGTYNIQG